MQMNRQIKKKSASFSTQRYGKIYKIFIYVAKKFMSLFHQFCQEFRNWQEFIFIRKQVAKMLSRAICVCIQRELWDTDKGYRFSVLKISSFLSVASLGNGSTNNNNSNGNRKTNHNYTRDKPKATLLLFISPKFHIFCAPPTTRQKFCAV